MGWLADGFAHPQRVELASGHHLRPIRASDVAIDYVAVMGSRERLWQRYGEAWGWPPATMSWEDDHRDLARHEAEIRAHESFNYAVLDAGERTLLGCLYIDPPEDGGPTGAQAVVSWWLVDGMGGSSLERALAAFVPAWLRSAWGFETVWYYP